MVTEWFIGKEIITAMSVMLVAWPVGIALALLTQGHLAQAYGWPGVMLACAVAALLALTVTASAYRAPAAPGAAVAESLRFGVPLREAVHISLVGICWACYNATIIVLPSFGPDALTARGWTITTAQSATSLMLWAMLVSLPLGGRLMEKFGYITLAITVFLSLATASIVLLFFGVIPAAMFVLFGLTAGVPGGALMALTGEALSPANRGPGLGIFYTWYYAGVAIAPAAAGWLRDATGNPGMPLLLAGAFMVATVSCVLLLRILQARWPISKAA